MAERDLPPTRVSRACPVCGASLEDHADPTLACCSEACHAEMSRVLQLLAGTPVDGFTCVNDYLDRGGESARETGSQAGEKSAHDRPASGTRRRDTRTSRAEAWLARRVREAPGHVTRGARLYDAYRVWAQEEDPGGALGYTAFLHAVDRAAPIERRVRLMTERGRPQLAFQGIVLTRRGRDNDGRDR